MPIGVLVGIEPTIPSNFNGIQPEKNKKMTPDKIDETFNELLAHKPGRIRTDDHEGNILVIPPAFGCLWFMFILCNLS